MEISSSSMKSNSPSFPLQVQVPHAFLLELQEQARQHVNALSRSLSYLPENLEFWNPEAINTLSVELQELSSALILVEQLQTFVATCPPNSKVTVSLSINS